MALIIQANVGKNIDTLHCVLETAKDSGADLVLFQEPPRGRGEFAPRHPAYDFIWAQWGEGRVVSAKRKDSEWNFSKETRFTRAEAEGGCPGTLSMSQR